MTNITKEKLKPGEIIPLSFDYVFTTIFNKQENIQIIENFISSYLDLPIEKIRGKIKILSRELELESKLSKNKQVDLLLELDDEKINIELSNDPSNGIIDRNIIYACNIHSRSLKYAENNYKNIKRTIQINLNNKHTNKRLKETYYLKNEDGTVLSEKFQIEIIDMVIGNRLCYTNGETKLARWCKVITSSNEEEFVNALGGIMEQEAKDKLVDEVNKYSSDDEVIALYSAYTREELERNTLILEAEERGIEKRNLEIAKNMLNRDFPVDVIKEVTGLTQAQIEELK